MASKWKKDQRPDGKFRRSQVLTNYGAGAMVDLVHQAVLISGIDHWRAPAEHWEKIYEVRLQDQMTAKFREQGKMLSQSAPFRMPPAGNDQEPTFERGIEAIEFPTWFICQNQQCRALIKNRSLEFKSGRYRHDCTRKGSECVPVRFVMACKYGHLDEFPWQRFVHEGKSCESPSLRMEEGPMGDFGSIFVKCLTCLKVRNLMDARHTETNDKCWGTRPWLGKGNNSEDCDQKQRLLIRTASNAYFSQVESALSIPETGDRVYEVVTSKIERLKKCTTTAKLEALKELDEEMEEVLKGLESRAVVETIIYVNAGYIPEREPLRTAEYKALVESPNFEVGVIAPEGADFFARTLTEKPPRKIAQVVLASALREVRVQVGFTRLDSPTANLQGEFDMEVRIAEIGVQNNWLPAIEIRGEGIFLRLDEDELREWESRPEVIERAKVLYEGFLIETADQANADFPGMRFYLLHSLSHLLLTALSLNCGYSASAIRERIYCSEADSETPMAGILLSTGSPGSGGTLGGLVHEGHRLGYHLKQALMQGELCSNDPVCAMHVPTDHAERYLDGAACHGCLFISESSCEKFNSYLDRALVISTIGHPANLAFFELEG